MTEKHNGKSGYDTSQRTDGDFVLYPFIMINGYYKEYIGTHGVRFNTMDDCIASGNRWMSLHRDTQLAMRTNPDYYKFVS